jgi:hypothetical protein
MSLSRLMKTRGTLGRTDPSADGGVVSGGKRALAGKPLAD